MLYNVSDKEVPMDEINEIVTDWNGAPIGIGTPVNVDNGGNVKNKSGSVTEIIFKGSTRDDVYLRVSGIKNLTKLQYVTVLKLTEYEEAIYDIFAENGVNLGIAKIKEYSERLMLAIPTESDASEG